MDLEKLGDQGAQDSECPIHRYLNLRLWYYRIQIPSRYLVDRYPSLSVGIAIQFIST